MFSLFPELLLGYDGRDAWEGSPRLGGGGGGGGFFATIIGFIFMGFIILLLIKGLIEFLGDLGEITSNKEVQGAFSGLFAIVAFFIVAFGISDALKSGLLMNIVTFVGLPIVVILIFIYISKSIYGNNRADKHSSAKTFKIDSSFLDNIYVLLLILLGPILFVIILNTIWDCCRVVS